MNPLLQYCLELGVLTGSRAFGVEKEDSDWDIVITESQVPWNEYYKLEDYDKYTETCASWNDKEEPYDADGIDSLNEIYTGSIWGPICEIIKWHLYDRDDELTTINLFIYPDKEINIVNKFREVNALMMFTTTYEQRVNKPTRVKKFVEILTKLEINKKD